MSIPIILINCQIEGTKLFKFYCNSQKNSVLKKSLIIIYHYNQTHSKVNLRKISNIFNPARVQDELDSVYISKAILDSLEKFSHHSVVFLLARITKFL